MKGNTNINNTNSTKSSTGSTISKAPISKQASKTKLRNENEPSVVSPPPPPPNQINASTNDSKENKVLNKSLNTSAADGDAANSLKSKKKRLKVDTFSGNEQIKKEPNGELSEASHANTNLSLSPHTSSLMTPPPSLPSSHSNCSSSSNGPTYTNG